MRTPNQCMQRMRASRLGQLQLGRQRQLARTADAGRYTNVAVKSKYNVTWPSFVFLPAIFVGWTLVTIEGLTGPQRGEPVKLWWWMMPIYQFFGYWPTMLLPSVLGLFC